MRYRFLVILFVFLLAVFVGANYLVWRLWTKELMSVTDGAGGDLARMGYISGVKMPRKKTIDLPKRHLDWYEYQGGPIDMVTVGDSYSQGGGEGRNRYYQDYIATFHDLRVVNLPPLKIPGENDDNTHFLTVLKLANSGWLRERQVKYLLLESIEWLCVYRFSRPYDFKLTDDQARLNAYFAKGKPIETVPESRFINNGNLKWLIQPISYRLFDRSFNKKVYRAQLDRNLFSVPASSTLYFYRDSVKTTPKFSTQDVKLLNDNINQLADLLKTQGVQLIFMPCVDKYNLYADYIVDNKYPRSTFFEKLRMLPKRYRFIDTKALLTEEVRAGVKDVYYADDTHWSWKASEIIFSREKFDVATTK